MKIKQNMKKKRIAVMVMAAFLMINIIITSFSVLVRAEYNGNVPVSEIDMGDYNDIMTVGEKQLLSVTVLPLDATNQTVKYSSSNTTVASINSMGRISALSAGKTTITASCQGKKGAFTLNVNEKIDSNAQVKELDLGDYESEMEVGSSQLLNITPLPIDVTEATITYKSSNPRVATINRMGRVKAINAGKTKIIIKCGKITSSIQISVVPRKDGTVEVKDIEIANHEDELKVDETMSLTATVLPADATDATVSYKSSNEKIATVNSSGEVKGISAGTVTITVSAGAVTKNVKLKVVVPTKAIKMNRDYLVLKPGDKFKLSGKVVPSDAVQSLSYKSMNQRVAKVSESGEVTAIAVGDTSIIVSNGDMQAGVSIIVNMSEKSSQENNETSKNEIEDSLIIEFDKVVNASDINLIDAKLLKYLYENKTNLLVEGNGYSIFIDGNDIVNYLNELSTDIKLDTSAEEYNKKGTSFVINDSNPICGEMTVSLDNNDGKYLYLFNESKNQYEMISAERLTEIKISTPGKYFITNSKMGNGNRITIIIMIVGTLAVIIGLCVYIGLKKQYWFW